MSDLDEFVGGYIETGLWCSSIEDDFANDWAAKHPNESRPAPDTSMQSFGFTEDDLAAETVQEAREDCAAFLAANQADIDAYGERLGEWHGSDSVRGADARYSALERAGGDFWLTRNGHGAGFWDRGLDELGERLTRAAKAHGESTLYIGDDGRIYVT